MKNLIIATLIALSSTAYAQDNCLAEAEAEVQTYMKKNLKSEAKNYSSVYVTGETLDGDTADTYEAEDGSTRLRYASPMYEVFKIVDNKNGAIKDLVIVELALMTDNETGEFLECAMGSAEQIDESNWSEFIDN